MDLHAQVDALDISRVSTRIAIHALIELGIIVAIECAHPECIRPDRAFKLHPRTDVISIGHIIPRHLGGSDLPSNMRLEHFGCNSGWRKSHRPALHAVRCIDCGGEFNGERGVKIHKARGGCIPCECGTRFKNGYALRQHGRDCVAVARVDATASA